MFMRALVAILFVFSTLALAGENAVLIQMRELQSQMDQLKKKVESQDQLIGDQKETIDYLVGMRKRSFGTSPAARALGDHAGHDHSGHEKGSAEESGGAKTGTGTVRISAVVDTAFRYYDGPADTTDRPAGSDFSIRTAQFIFSGDLSEHYRAYMVFNAIPDAAEGDEAAPDLEEAAIVYTPTDNLSFKAGRFFAPFGRLAPMHGHALPFVTLPSSLQDFIGGESIADGAAVEAKFFGDRLTVNAGVFNKLGEGFPLLNPSGTRRSVDELTYLLRAFTHFNPAAEHRLEVGASGLLVPDSTMHRNLVGLDLNYLWKPCGKKRLIWGTELMRNELRTTFNTAEPDEAPVFRRDQRSGFGGYSYVEYFVNDKLSLGPRIDAFENTDPTREERRGYEKTYTMLLTYRVGGENNRVRLEASRHEFFSGQRSNELYLQWTVELGSHDHGHEHSH